MKENVYSLCKDGSKMMKKDSDFNAQTSASYIKKPRIKRKPHSDRVMTKINQVTS